MTRATHSDRSGGDGDSAMTPVLVLFLLGSAVHAGPLTKAGKTEGGVSPQQEVNLLMFGIIQFSQAFKHVHETTEAKMEKVGQVLRRQEEALRRLGAQTERAAEVEREIKEALRWIQVREDGGKNVNRESWLLNRAADLRAAQQAAAEGSGNK